MLCSEFKSPSHAMWELPSHVQGNGYGLTCLTPEMLPGLLKLQWVD